MEAVAYESLMTVKDLAKYLKTTPNALYVRMHRGEGPPRVQFGQRRVLFRREEVDAWLNAQRE